jgi:large subunit ribosomal protein L29
VQADEIRELTDEDIRARVAELTEERFRLRFRGATEAPEEPLRVRVIRREVARLKTIMHERATGVKVPADKKKGAVAKGGTTGRSRSTRGGKKS